MQWKFFIADLTACLCLSSVARECYTGGCCLWFLVLWFSSCPYCVELRVMCPICGLLVLEICWASNKICNKNHLLHLVDILFPHINDDARSKSLQMKILLSMFRKFTELRSSMPKLKHGTTDDPTKFYKCQFCADYAVVLKHKYYLCQLYLHSIYNLLLKYALPRRCALLSYYLIHTNFRYIFHSF
jgi:hypothetical protein